MALNQLGLGFIFTAKDEASRVMDGLHSKFTKMDSASNEAAQSFKGHSAQLAIGLGVAAAGVVGLGAAFAASKTAGEFEQGLVSVQQITMATTADMVRLRKAALDAGIATKFSPKEAVAGLEVLGQAGLTATESIGSLIPVLNLATGGNISIEQSAETAVAAMNIFGIGVNELTTATDKMFRASQQSTLSMLDLQLGLGNIGRIAGSTNQSLDEMLITMGLVKDTGVDVSTASTATAMALANMGSKADDFNKLGVAIDDGSGKFRDFADIVVDLNEVLEKKFSSAVERSAIVSKLFGQRGIAAYSGVIGGLQKQVERSGGALGNMHDAITMLRKGMASAGGTTQKFADAMLDTFEGQKTLLRGTIETISVLVGEGFAKVFKPIVAAFNSSLATIADFINRIPASTKTALAKLFLGLSTVAVILGTIIAAKAGIALLALGFGALGLTIAGVLAPLLPILGAVAALGLIIAALVVRSKQMGGGFVAVFSEMFDKIKLFFKATMQLFSEGAFSGEVLAELDKGNGGVKEFAITAFLWFNRIKAFFMGLADGFSEGIAALSPVFDSLLNSFNVILEALGFTANKAETNRGIWAAFAATGNVVGQVLASVAAIITGPIAAAFAILAGLIQEVTALWNDFGFLFANVGDAMKSVWNGVVSFIIAGIRALLGPLETIGKFAGFGDEINAAFAAVERAATFQIGATAGDNQNFRPAVAQTQALTQSNAGTAAAISGVGSAVQQSANRPIQVQSTTNLILDGEKLQSSVVRQTRSSDARSLLPVMSTEGAGG